MMKPEPMTINDYQSIVDAYHQESERAAVILAGSFVEHYLGTYLTHFMIRERTVESLFGGFGPLATFDQRIQVAYAFNLIPRAIYDDLRVIKEIRNEFAHAPRERSLSDADLRPKLGKLSTAVDPAFNGAGEGPLTDVKLIYLFAVARFVGFAYNVIRKPSDISPTGSGAARAGEEE